MANRIHELLNNPATRHYVRVVAFVVLGVSAGALLMTAVIRPETYVFDRVNEFTSGEEAGGAPEEAPYTLERSLPVRITAPSVYLDATFEPPLGLAEDGSADVPDSFEEVGWYKYSPTPGELGPAVIFGHVDSYKGPAVFFGIGRLAENDPIYITREDGTTATFRVVSIGRYEQQEFPKELVYGDIDHAGLRLITCSGVFDHGTQKYSHNTVVYARLEAPENADGETEQTDIAPTE